MFGHSAGVARALDPVLDHVVAIEGELPDQVVRRFVELFYQMISAGRSYRTAFGAACLTLQTAASDRARFVFCDRLASVPGRVGRAPRRRHRATRAR